MWKIFNMVEKSKSLILKASHLMHAFLFIFCRWNATFMDYSSHVGEVKEYGKDRTLIKNVNVDMSI